VRVRCGEPAPPELVHGVAQFNDAEFFEQHETLELLWRDTRTPVRALYHGILQIGVGFHHWRNGNFHGASTLLDEGIQRVRPFAPRCQGVDVEALIADATRAREQLIALGAEGMRGVDIARVAPRIRFTP
jgi:predicted metal-dependent hydrolase